MARHKVYATSADRQWAYRLRQKRREQERMHRMELEQITQGLAELVAPRSAFEEFEEVPGRVFFKHESRKKSADLGDGSFTRQEVTYRAAEGPEKVSGLRLTFSRGTEERIYLIDDEERAQLRATCANLRDLARQATDTLWAQDNAIAYVTRSGLTLEAKIERLPDPGQPFRYVVTLADLLTVKVWSSDDLREFIGALS